MMVDQSPHCAVCSRIRMLLILGAICFFLFSTQPESDFLIGVDVTKVFTWVLAAVFILIIIWKLYHEFWKKRHIVGSKKSD